MSEVLSSAAPLVRTRGPVPLVTSIAIGTAAVLIAAAGVVTTQYAGGGQQPEDVLPRSTVAVVKLDLDPSLSQKKAIYSLSKKFNKVKTKGEKSVRDDLLSGAFDTGDLDYNRDVKPWLGDRVAIGAVADGSEDGFAAVAAVQYTDKGKAEKALKKSRQTHDDFAYAFAGDYVIVADTQAEADRYAKADKHLSDNPTYSDAVDALDGDQLLVGWADVQGAYKAVPEAQRKNTPFANLKDDPSGAVVIGAHASSRYLEIQGKAVDVGDSLKQYGGAAFGSGRGHNLLASFPADTAAALEVTGLGDSLTKAYASLADAEGFSGFQDSAKQFGLTLPDDIPAVFGSDFAVAGFGDLANNPSVVAHVKTSDPDRAVSVFHNFPAGEDGPPLLVQPDAGGGYYLGTDAAVIAKATGGRLGETAAFTLAVPDAKDAGFALYVDIARIAKLADSSPDELDALQAFGMTSDGEKGEFRIRLTVR